MKNFNKYIIHVETAWCGEYNDYAAIAEDEIDLLNLAEELSYNNFADFSGFEQVLSDLFAEQLEEGEDYTDEMISIAENQEYDYYSSSISLFEGTDEEWEDYELVYDASLKTESNGVD